MGPRLEVKLQIMGMVLVITDVRVKVRVAHFFFTAQK